METALAWIQARECSKITLIVSHNTMDKQNPIYRIMNYCPWPGMFNLLEILIFVAGILVVVLHFRFTSVMDETSDLIHRINLILSLSAASLLFIIASMMWRNRKIQQSQMKQLESEIEQRFRLNAALNTEQNKLSTLLVNWPDPVFLLDIHANIMDANPAAAHVLGYAKPEPLLGKNNVEFAPSELANEILEVNQGIFKTGKPLINKEATVLNQTTGKWQNLLITKAPYYDQHQQIAGLVVIGQNITAQKQTQDELRLVNQKLSASIADLEQRTQGVNLITQMVDLLSASTNVEEAYKIIENQLGKLNLADSGMLYMIKSSRNNLQQAAAWGQSVSDSPIFAPGDCWGLRRGRLHTAEFDHSACYDDYQANPLICPHISSTMPTDCLCVPLVAHGETLGILHLRHVVSQETIKLDSVHHGWFTPQRIQRINIIAESLALTLANLMLRTTLRQQSIRDPLTGLYNRRYLEESLERELLRASRSNKNTGLMMIDIDHFKRFNDTYGHPAADAVLSTIANFLLSSVRREDLVCRYGGEEILIMLPETDLEATYQRAEAIREGVAQLHVQYQGRVLEHVSLSIGVGTFPEHGQTPEAIIHSVDQALYRAKHNGRNRVEVAAPFLLVPRPDPWHRRQSQAEDHRTSALATVC